MNLGKVICMSLQASFWLFLNKWLFCISKILVNEKNIVFLYIIFNFYYFETASFFLQKFLFFIIILINLFFFYFSSFRNFKIISFRKIIFTWTTPTYRRGSFLGSMWLLLATYIYQALRAVPALPYEYYTT